MHTFLLLLLVLQPMGSSQPERNVILRETKGPTPVTDKDLRPVRPPDCRNEAEVQKALEQISYGEPGQCFIKDITAFNRR
jgi:hypothetical protein